MAVIRDHGEFLRRLAERLELSVKLVELARERLNVVKGRVTETDRQKLADVSAPLDDVYSELNALKDLVNQFLDVGAVAEEHFPESLRQLGRRREEDELIVEELKKEIAKAILRVLARQ